MRFLCGLAVGVAASGLVALIHWRRLAHRTCCLKLTQEIPLLLAGQGKPFRAFAEGRIDHFACDAKRKLLFVACLGHDCVLVVDAFTGKVITMLCDGLSQPQGVLFVEDTCRLYVANAKDGVVTIFDGHSWKRLGSVDFGDEADNLRYENGRVYVGYGEGAIGAIIDDVDSSMIGRDTSMDMDMPCGGHPESFQLEPSGRRIWVNVADERLVLVLDRTASTADEATVARWPLPDGMSANFPMHADEASRLLFVGVRKPTHRACVLVLDMDSGECIGRVPVPGDMDDLCFDALRSRLYVVSGTGCVSVLGRAPHGGRGSFEVIDTVPTVVGARTGVFYAERDSLYVAAPSVEGLPSRLLVFQGQGDASEGQ